jgi:cholesterol oxidase
VPAVFNKVTALTGKPKVDVVAHCMGTVVFSMAVLDPNPTAENKVRDQVERAAFTQVGPLVVFSPANRFRGYVLRYFVDFLPDNYSFNPPPTLAEDLWDRLLATLPYPVEEFDIENPPHFKARTPWTRTRHRMDALYGRDFNVANMEPAMLACIDDHFGALSLWTVKQTLNFVRYSLITNWHGRNEFVSRNQFQANWKFPTLSVHGAANGLAHVSTVDRMHAILGDAGRTHEFEILDDTGHQDALVGTKRSQALAAIEKFLSGPAPNPPGAGNDGLVAYTPWIGPIVTEQRDVTPALVVRVASSPMHRAAVGMVLLRVAIDGDRVVRPDDPSQLWDINYVMSHAELVLSNELTTKRWDAFEAPLPTSMPGYQAGDAIGDGLLVLILYADSALLEAERANAPVAYYGANASTNTVDILLPSPEFQYRQRPNRISYGYFEKAAAALLTALQKQPPSARERRRAARLTPGHPVLVRARMDSPLELPIEPVAIDVQLPATATALSFAVNTAQGAAVVAAIDQDDDLMDGVILYDPPQPPLAAPESSGTRFALVSCQYPGGFLDGPVAYASYRRMLQRFEGPPDQRPRFAVFTGDQVYVDPTAGLYDPNAQDDRYYRPYEVWLRQQPVRSVLRRIPSFMLLDDHEIHDNWEPVPPQSKENKENTGDKAGGVTAYEKFQRGMVPKPPSFAFAIEGFRFFMLDTRTQRSLRTVGSLAPSTLFPAATLTALKTFLQSDPQNPKFVVTPSMLLPRHRRAVQHAPPGGGVDADNLSAVHSDGWDGYPESLAAVLGFIAEQGIQHVVFLSGDEHRGCVARIELRQGGALRALLHSIHTTAAYAPFPFANSLPEDFVTTDVFAFDYSGTTYECIVNAMLPATRDGATLLRPWRDGSTVGLWHLDYEYADGGVQTLTL